jgi:hypothetical protein
MTGILEKPTTNSSESNVHCLFSVRNMFFSNFGRLSGINPGRPDSTTPPVTNSSPQPWSASGIAETGLPLYALKPRAEDRACVTPRSVTNSTKSSVQGEK